jgi:hypothetical protein
MTSVLIRLIRWLGHVKLVNRGLAVNLSFLLVPLWAGRGHHSYPTGRRGVVHRRPSPPDSQRQFNPDPSSYR